MIFCQLPSYELLIGIYITGDLFAFKQVAAFLDHRIIAYAGQLNLPQSRNVLGRTANAGSHSIGMKFHFGARGPCSSCSPAHTFAVVSIEFLHNTGSNCGEDGEIAAHISPPAASGNSRYFHKACYKLLGSYMCTQTSSFILRCENGRTHAPE